MITAKLEELLLKQKAQRFQITIGDGPLSILQVPPGKTIIITDIDIIPTINAPGSNVINSARTKQEIIEQFIKLQSTIPIDLPFISSVYDEVYNVLEKTVSRSVVQLIEQSAKINNTYTCAPNLYYRPDISYIVDPNSGTGYGYTIGADTAFITKNSQFDVYSIHADNITFRWAYPYAVAGIGNPVFNLLNVEYLNPNYGASFITPTIFENQHPNGLKDAAINNIITALYVYATTQIGAWAPIGIDQLSANGVGQLVTYQGFNYIRYPIELENGFNNINLGQHTVDYGFIDTGLIPNILIYETIFEYIGKPKANIGYVVINENLTF